MSYQGPQHDKSLAMRERIRRIVITSIGITTADVSVSVGLSRQGAYNHLIALTKNEAIKSAMHMHSRGGEIAVWYSIDAKKMDYVQPEKKLQPVTSEDDFIGVKTVRAVQLGMARDPLTAALFGDRRGICHGQ